MDRNGTIVFDYEFLFELLKTASVKSGNRKIAEFHNPPDPHLYLDGIHWITEMYTTGVCPDYRQCFFLPKTRILTFRYLYDALGPSSEELCDAILERQECMEYELDNVPFPL